MDSVSRQLGSKSYGVVHALAIFGFSFQRGVAGQPVVQRFAQRKGA